MKHAHMPSVDIVICSLNGSTRIRRCLESLVHQSYPKDAYRIIVVDDGSTDNTSSVAQEYPQVKVVRHDKNQGRPNARNSGLQAAGSTLVAYIDDDCVADSRWLEHLVQPFADRENIVAVGGKIVARKTTRFAERYLQAVGYGNPAPLEFGQSPHPLRRLLAYIKSMFRPIAQTTSVTEVQAVFTANVAYKRDALKDIGGFDNMLASDEDVDVATRLKAAGGHLFFAPNAIVSHGHHETIRAFATDIYKRAENTLRYYQKENKSLPIFPMPLMYAFVLVVASIVWLPLGLLWMLCGPLVVYCWWIVRAMRSRKPEQILYGYAQLVLETAFLAGLLRGMVRQKKFKRA